MIAVAWILMVLLLVATGYRALFALAHLLRARRRRDGAPGRERRFAVVIPAHDEELLIDQVIASIRDAEYPQDRIAIHVVADNCSDETAERVRALGEQVAERRDLERRGKGQALDWMFRRLDLDGVDAVALFDADNLVDPGFFRAMNRELERGGRCLQGYYGIANPDASVLTRLLAVTYVMKNLLYNDGKAALGLSVTLMGTGMVFLREVIQTAGWRAMSIAEDLEQTLNLMARGERIRFVADARVRAQESTTLRQGYTQRQRWVTGRRALTRAALRTIGDGLRRGSLHQVDCGVDLLMLDYSEMMNWSILGLILALVLQPAAPGLLVAIGIVLGYQAIEVGGALWLMRAGPRFLASLAFAPVFLLYRATIDVLGFFGYRRHQWTRTARTRHPEQSP